MSNALGWIFKVSASVSLISLLAILASGNGQWLDGFVAGAVIALLSLLIFIVTIKYFIREDKESSPLILLGIMPIKLLLVGALAYLLVVVVKVSAIGFVVGLGNVPIAVALHGMFGKVEKPE